MKSHEGASHGHKLQPEQVNHFQSALIETYDGEPHEWIQEHAADFRELLEHMPELIREFDEKPDETNKKMVEILRRAKERGVQEVINETAETLH
jgi:PAS domain-containing protein